MELTKDEKYVRDCITEIYPQLLVNTRNVCGAAYNKHGGDLLALCIEYYLKKDIEYQLKVIYDGKLEHFITHMMNFQLKHATTKFYHHYRKHHEKQREWLPNYDYGLEYDGDKPFSEEVSDVMQCIEHMRKELNPYEAMLITEYVINELNFQEISKKYNIAYYHLKRDLEQVLLNIKQTCGKLR